MIPRRLSTIVVVVLSLWVASLRATAQGKVDSSILEKFFGFYEVSPGKYIYIQPMSEQDGKLIYATDDGQERVLFSSSLNVFSAGPGLLIPEPEETKLTFSQDSNRGITRVTLQQHGVPDRVAKKVHLFNQEVVHFRNGDVTLTGVLLTPLSKGPHPAIVLVAGAGPAERFDMFFPAHFAVLHGVALLSYDKRGVRDSTGDWRKSGFEDLAGDAIAGVQFLKGRKDIDARRIGIMGSSQGGWIGPLAASKSADIGFVISICGPAISPAEQELDRVEHDLRSRDFSETEISDALDLMRLRDDVYRGNQPWEKLQETKEKLTDKKWLQYVPMPRTRESTNFEFYRRLPLDYDSAPALEKLRVPVLAIFGGVDQNVLPEKNSQAWRMALEKGGDKDYMIRILPHGRHGLLESQTGADVEVPHLKRIVPEYVPLALAWLRTHGIATK